MFSKYLKTSIFSSIGLGVLGAFLLFQSEFAIVSLSYIIGGILVAIGVLGILKYLKDKDSKNSLDIVYGIVTIILGIIVISNPKAIASIIPFVIGIIIILNSVAKLQYSLELRKSNNKFWKSTAILSIVTVIVGIVLIFNPFKGAEIITKIIGILILVYALIDISTTIAIRKTINKIDNVIEEKITEAEIVEEKDDTKK